MCKCCQCKCCKAERKPRPRSLYVLRYVNVYLSISRGWVDCGDVFSSRAEASSEDERKRGLGDDMKYLKTIQVKIPR